jgi:two-component system, OmpR family, sensor histidine kinase KdpD
VRSSNAAALARWILFTALMTAALVSLRGTLDKAHVALAYLLLVLLGASRLGRRAGVGLAVLSFFCFNFFLLPPYHTLAVADSRDWLVLLAFLLTSLVAAQLLYRAQDEADVARQRTAEVDRLSTLGAETLNAVRPEAAIGSIATVIQSTLNLESCEVYLSEGSTNFRLAGRASRDGYQSAPTHTDELFDYLLDHDAIAIERVDGAIHVIESNDSPAFDTAFTQRDARMIVIPLRVQDRRVGILRLADADRIFLDAPQRRFAEALAYYAALGVERVRLSDEAGRAQALEAADRIKDAFIAAVSHDLRTPLTTIKGLAHELSASGDERASIIETEADRLNRLVEDLLDLSQLNAGALMLNPQLNAAEDLAGAMLSRLAGLERSEDVKAVLPPGELVIGRFDFAHSLRALVNLAENAIKYSSAGSIVEVAVKRADPFVSFVVSDRGRGIKPADADRIFEPFVRGEGGTASGSGAGLGLAIAQRIASAQGGRVSYHARAGGGSVFTLDLPIASLPDSEPPKS